VQRYFRQVAADSIVTSIVIVVILCILVMFMDFAIPLFMKLDFNRTSKMYATLVAAEGELTPEQVTAFKQTLEERGFENIVITVDNTSGFKFGDPINFSVMTTIKSHRRTSVFDREEYQIPCQFETELHYRKYIQ